jgi:hypothetical protein
MNIFFNLTEPHLFLLNNENKDKIKSEIKWQNNIKKL